jgi:hypothetical protein
METTSSVFRHFVGRLVGRGMAMYRPSTCLASTVSAVAEGTLHVWPLQQGILECVQRGTERAYALKFSVLTFCPGCSCGGLRGSDLVGSSESGMATDRAGDLRMPNRLRDPVLTASGRFPTSFARPRAVLWKGLRVEAEAVPERMDKPGLLDSWLDREGLDSSA